MLINVLCFNCKGFLHRQCATCFDHNIFSGTVIGTGLYSFHLFHNVLRGRVHERAVCMPLQQAHHSIKHHSKYNVPAIQPRSLNSGDKELGAIGVLPSISHTQIARSSVLQLEVFIWEFVPINTLPYTRVDTFTSWTLRFYWLAYLLSRHHE